MARLMGIDPGLRFTGWGVIDVHGNRLRHVADGVIATDNNDSVPHRLKFLHDALTLLFQEHRPDEAAVEETYVNRNGTATLKLGYARGVALLAPALAGITVAEYGAMGVKQAVVGTGGASKEQVQFMLTRLLRLKSVPQPTDAADGVAAALACVMSAGIPRIDGFGAVREPSRARSTSSAGSRGITAPVRCWRRLLPTVG